MAAIYQEEGANRPDASHLAELKAAASKLCQERRQLQVFNHGEVRRIRSEYGSAIREWRELQNEGGNKRARWTAMLALVAEQRF
jgi:hypothetical protein